MKRESLRIATWNLCKAGERVFEWSSGFEPQRHAISHSLWTLRARPSRSAAQPSYGRIFMNVCLLMFAWINASVRQLGVSPPSGPWKSQPDGPRSIERNISTLAGQTSQPQQRLKQANGGRTRSSIEGDLVGREVSHLKDLKDCILDAANCACCI